MSEKRDHGGGLDAAVAEYGGVRGDWLDLSTGINPVPYPVGELSADAWTALPDQGAMDRLLAAARAFWNVPDGAQIVAANGASALIAQMPRLASETDDSVYIPTPTYNEHAAAFRAADFHVMEHPDPDERVQVFVHPNNPTGTWKSAEAVSSRRMNIIDESFCDIAPAKSHITLTDQGGIIVLKSFGKFWGLAGARLGFAICGEAEARKLRNGLGPWAVSGPSLEIGARALADVAWAEETRVRLAADAVRLDNLVGLPVVGGTDLFRLYEVEDAEAAQAHLAKGRVWSRIFPYSKTWLRLGLPHPDRWDQLEAAVEGLR
ncbi:MAG TPA: threonine-phosphate decarboxylase [Octadecabacter sp.]|nr:threonine-phosphate decarboxylase [Octadecabacter sp.]